MLSEGEKKVYQAIYLNKEGLHIRDISRISELTLPAVLKHIARGEIEGAIFTEKKGRLKICRLNFRNQNLIPVLQSVELSRFNKLPHSIQDSSNSFMHDLKEKPLISLIFGSYAKGNYSKKSDLDMLLAFQRIDAKLMRDAEISASKISGRTGVNIQPASMGYDEFEREFMSHENEFMKDIRKNAMAIQGLDAYLKLLGRFYS